MPRLTVVNLCNSPFDLEGGERLPAMGRVTGNFSEEYAEALKASPGLDVRLPAPEDRLSDERKAELLAKRDSVDHDGNGRKGGPVSGRRGRRQRG